MILYAAPESVDDIEGTSDSLILQHQKRASHSTFNLTVSSAVTVSDSP